MKIVAVVGSRTPGTDNQNSVDAKVAEIIDKLDKRETYFMSGGAPTGADKSIKNLCNTRRLPYIEAPAFWHKPTWSQIDKSAGFRRNSIIAELCTELYAFWDGKSSGTKDTIDKALALQKPVHIINLNK